MPKDVKKEKSHTKFRPAYHQGTPYLERVVSLDTLDDSRFICIKCKEKKYKPFGGYCENIKVHLKNKNHKSTFIKGSFEEREYLASMEFLDGRLVDYPELTPDFGLNQNEGSGKCSNEIALKFDIVNYIISQNLPFTQGQELLKFIQSTLKKYEPETIAESKIYPSQIGIIAKNCIADSIKEDIFTHLEEHPFSIAVDEGSTKFGDSFLAVTVRFFTSERAIFPQTKLLALIQIGDSSTGEVLYGKINQLLFAGPNGEKIRKNFMGICSDHASNMISEGEKGLANRLRLNFPNIFVTHDYCHAYNLILREAISRFPPEIVTIVTDLCNYFANSPQKRARFLDFQVSLGMAKPLDIPSYIKTRWLSFRESLDRILTLITPVSLYFEEHGNRKQKNYFTQTNIVFLHVLSCLVNKIGHYIQYFEYEELTNECIARTIRESVIIVADLVLDFPDIEMTALSQAKRFEEIASLTLSDEDDSSTNPIYRSLESFVQKFLQEYPHLEEDLLHLGEDDQIRILESAKGFLVGALGKMKKWLPLHEKSLYDSECIGLKRFDFEAWKRLRVRFNNIIEPENSAKFQSELTRLKLNYPYFLEELNQIRETTENTFNEIIDYRFSQFWISKRNQFPFLFKLARALMVFPFSSCSIERSFSQCTDIKTIRRNRLSVENLEACLIIKQEFGDTLINIPPHIIDRYSRLNIATAESIPIEDPPQHTELQTVLQPNIEEEIEVQGQNNFLLPVPTVESEVNSFSATIKP